tara:strand:- start:159 stop:404 length:246 start_codon:yes stop_codon:yes gene_type:complete
LHQNYPNLFNPQINIKYDIAVDSLVDITFYNMLGRGLRNLVNIDHETGCRSIKWDAGKGVSEGVSDSMFIYTIQAGYFRAM